MKLRYVVFLLLASLAVSIAQPAERDSTMLHIGSEKQYFIDDVMIESLQNLTRRVHKPEKLPSPVITNDRPWEHITYFTVSSYAVIFDPVDQMFKCWYEDFKFLEPPKWDGGLIDADLRPTRYLFARSKDGVHWEKPPLGIIQEDGHDTNIVLGGPDFGIVHAGYVFLDTLEADPSRRFKMFFEHRTPNKREFALASSGNGINWTLWDEAPRVGAAGAHLGDVLTISIDPNGKLYRLNTRHPRMMDIVMPRTDPYLPRTAATADEKTSFLRPIYPEDFSKKNRRRVYQAMSSDFVHWTDLRPLMAPDAEIDNIDDAFYGLTQIPMGPNWIGFLNVLHMTENTMDVQLVFSRDGMNFQRIQPGKPWLETGEPGSWDEFMVCIYGEPMVVGDDIYVFYGGSSNHHDWWMIGEREGLDVPEAHDVKKVDYSLGLARMKVDRFVSLSTAGPRQGILVTRPFKANGTELWINAKVRPGGELQVALADADGHVVRGYEAENSTLFTGDSTSHQVTWKAGKEIPETSGFLRLQFFLKDAELFTFQIRP